MNQLNSQPQSCSDINFMNAQVNQSYMGWTQAGNGESFKVQMEDSQHVYVRTGRRYWRFATQEPMNHAAIIARVQGVIAQERADDLLEIV